MKKFRNILTFCVVCFAFSVLMPGATECRDCKSTKIYTAKWLHYLRPHNWRFLQIITGFHYIHCSYYSFGWKFPFLPYAYFREYGNRKKGYGRFHYLKYGYHDCTKENVY